MMRILMQITAIAPSLRKCLQVLLTDNPPTSGHDQMSGWLVVQTQD
jgi:hypothetical protein